MQTLSTLGFPENYLKKKKKLKRNKNQRKYLINLHEV